MAIPFLNHLDLLDVSEIQNAILHKTTSAVATDVEGKIIYDTGSDTIKYYNGSAWISLTGDTDNFVDSIAFNTGDGVLTLGRTGSLPDLTVDLDGRYQPAGSYDNYVQWQITDGTQTDDVTTDAIVKFAANSTPGTAGAALTGSGTTADPYVITYTFPNDNDDNFVDGASLSGSTLTLTRTGTLADLTVDLSSLDDTVRTVSVDTNGDGTVNNTLEDSEDLVLKKGTNITLTEAGGVVTISSTNTNQLTTWDLIDDDDDSFTIGHNKNIKFTAAAGTAGTDITGTGTDVDPYVVAITIPDTIDMGDGFIVSADTNTNATTITEGETLTIAGGTNITTETTADGTVTITSTAPDEDVSNANLLTRLANLESANGSGTDENIVIGASAGDTIVITGNLQVSGTTTTVNSTEVVVADNNIVLSKDNTTAAVIDGAGITLEGGTGDDATFTYSTTGPKFELKLGANYEDLQVDQLIAASLDISGDVDVDGTLEADAITVNGSTLNSVIDGRITAREYKANFPASATTAGDTITITHNLGTRDVIVQFYALVADIDGDANTPNVDQYEEVKLENIRATTNTITVAPNTGLVANALRVLIKEL